MEYFALAILALIVGERISTKKSNGTARTAARRGHKYYSIMGLSHIIIGGIGIWAINFFLRSMISQWFIIAVLIEFAIIMFTGVFYIYKMMISNEP